MRKISDYIVEFFVKKNVKVVFGYIGGMITHLVDSINKNEEINYIQVYHEQSGAIAAEGYARITGNVGVAIATSGPGATNMITGIANAYFDSIPVIYITGQVNSYEFKYDKPIRQLGFQETDIISMVKGITKYAKLVDNPDDIPYELEKAFSIANEGRKGPVLLDIPMNVQRTDIELSKCKTFKASVKRHRHIDWNIIIDEIKSAKRPMILVGGGANDSKSINQLDYLASLNIPIVCSLMGKGIVDEMKNSFVGMIGSYGNRCANMAINNCDILIALGTRLDTRQTGAQYQSFLKNGKILHVDVDENELDFHRLEERISIHSPVGEFLDELVKRNVTFNRDDKWMNFISYLKEKYNQKMEIERFVDNKIPYQFMDLINSLAPSNAVFTVDVGQNQMWAAQTLKLTKNQKFFTSGGHAPMGYALPAAVGCAMGNYEKRIIAICGDGGFHISTQSLLLISQYNLPITIFVFNNSSLGMITQFQSLYFEKRLTGTTYSGGYLVPDIEKMAEAYSIKYKQFSEEDIYDKCKQNEIFSHRHIIVEILIKGETTVSPKLEYNKPIDELYPYLNESEFMIYKDFLKSE